MHVYTGYFGMLRNIPQDLRPVSIARFSPQWYHKARYPELAPPEDLLRSYKKDEDFSRFTEQYFSTVLCNNVPIWVLDDLERISLGQDVVLLCWEKDSLTCHRSLVAKWLSTAVDYPITEWMN